MSNHLLNPVEIVDSTDPSKKIALDPSAATASTTATITTAQVANRTYSIPDSGASSAFVMAEGASTINGTKTFNGSVVIKESGGSDTITISAPVLAASYSLTLPVDDGTSNNQVLSTDGSGVLSWQSMLPAGIMMDFGGTSVPGGWLECDGAVVAQATYPNLFAALGTTWNTGGEGAGNFRLPGLNRRTTVGRGGSGTATLGNAVGNTGGAETHQLTTAELASHTHGVGTLANAISAVSGTISGSGTHNHSITDPGHSHAYYISAGAGSPGFEDTGDATPGGVGFIQVATSNVTVTAGEGSHTHTLSGATAAAQTISGSTASAGSDTAHNNIQPSAIVLKIIKY